MWSQFENDSVSTASPSVWSTRRAEIFAGLFAPAQATLPAWLLYDDRGCELFDRICELPEYYPTRTERDLLHDVASLIAHRTQARELLELGSGHARKTHLLLGAMGAAEQEIRYIPFDVSASAIAASSRRLTRLYPRLKIDAAVGDFTTDLSGVPAGERRLVAFLGGTIGNFDVRESHAFLSAIAASLGPTDSFLLAADLLKDRRLLHAAYNDSAGLTAEFNLNALHRVQREFRIEVELDDFVHHAFFSEDHSRIEIHARARRATAIVAPAAGLFRTLRAGESVRTEISRKFSREALEAMHSAAGLRIEAIHVSQTPYALVLSRRVDSPPTSL